MVKLDLFNSRIGVDLGPRVYDSLEGEMIMKAKPAPKSVHVAAFRNGQKRLDYMHKPEKTPDRFYDTVVDSKGTFIPLNKSLRYRPAASIPCVTNPDAGKHVPTLDVSKYPSALADKIKDKLYDVREDTVASRLVSGKLPGATWEVMGRVWVPPPFDVGPGSYEVYDKNLSHRGLNKLEQGKFNDAAGRKEVEVEVEFLPLHQRKRVQRKEKEWAEKTGHHNHFHDPCYVDLQGSLDSLQVSLSKSFIPTTLLAASKAGRFDHQIYRSEPYTKTSGMLLDPDFDRLHDKRLPCTFKSQRKIGGNDRSEGGEVDVDVGHLYSMTHASAVSPVKYSSAFNSKAEVGMEIPVPTSGVFGGPGAFPGAFPTSMHIHLPDRNSHFLLRGRTDIMRAPIPDLEEKVLPFAVRHRRGPIFEKQKVGGGNLVMQKLVEGKVRQIYPKMAREMFREEEEDVGRVSLGARAPVVRRKKRK